MIESPTMLSLADRIRNVHPNALRRLSKDAKYVSGGLQEYRIERNSSGYYYIKAYRGGRLHKSLQGQFISFVDCERKLVSHLRSNDKFGRAIYPHG